MINSFKDTPMRQSGVIYDGSFEQVKMMYAQDPQLAGELAISIIELTLTGGISSDNPLMPALLALQAKVVAKDKQKYESKVAISESKRYERLSQIAELYNQGYKQKEIAEMLGKSSSTISESLAQIRESYPELLNLEKSSVSSENSVSSSRIRPTSVKFDGFSHVTVTENENVTENVTENENENVTVNVAEPMSAVNKKTEEEKKQERLKGLLQEVINMSNFNRLSPWGKQTYLTYYQWMEDAKGVYGIFLFGRIVYIGKSINLYRRLNEHRLSILKALKKPLKGYPNRKYNYIASAISHHGATITYMVLKHLDGVDKKQLDK